MRKVKPLIHNHIGGLTETNAVRWEDAVQEAGEDQQQNRINTSIAEVKEITTKLGIDKESSELAREYLTWARALEIYSLRNCQEKPKLIHAHLGRATAPTTKMVPALRKPRLIGEVFDTLGGYGIVSRLWASIASLTRKLGNAPSSASANPS